MRFALKVYYDGRGFSGSQRQPHHRTVEGELLRSLGKLGIRYRDFQAAGRTDRGVSALGMVFALSTEDSIKASQLNAVLPGDVRVLAVKEVTEGFDPRRGAKGRTYKYYLFDEGYAVSGIRKAARAFVGAHDFHNFTKNKGDTVRRVTSVGLQKRSGFLVITIRGHAFLWQQVRRMVTALQLVGRAELTREDIARALQPETKKTFRPAPPEPLVLWEVKYDFDFQHEGYTARRFGQTLAAQMASISLRAAQIADIRRMI